MPNASFLPSKAWELVKRFADTKVHTFPADEEVRANAAVP
jgi:hypothetical protein